MPEARRWLVSGRVQGVGFRPFVFRLAQRYGLVGSVQNLAGQVLIEAGGACAALDGFAAALLAEAPPLARPQIERVEPMAALPTRNFEIIDSVASADAQVHVPPDYFLCDDCRREMLDPADRRYRYPFINCTQCGPRYTLIERLPYDRPNTSMAGFPMCPACRAEYDNPANRRFHAEPIACPQCGPQLAFVQHGQHVAGAAALDACVAALQRGDIVAVKGVGGYHLLCDALNESAIARLRGSKQRPHKPLAVLFPWQGSDGCDAVRAELELDDIAQQTLVDPMRPIVLLRRQTGSGLPVLIAPGLQEVGAMLPYSPLHHLLLDALGRPLVATSANISGEPVLTEAAEVEARLGQVAEAFLHHDRPIVRPADDSVLRISAGQARVIRAGRGLAPLELELPRSLVQPVLAVGGHTKNSVALGWGRRVVVSPHIGDLDALRSLEVFEQVIHDLQRLYGVEPALVVSDAHSQYGSSRWASAQKLPLKRVWHHHAHASALALEYGAEQTWLTFTWDGVGLGEDDTLWGGEALLGRPGSWQRVGRLRPFRLPGGERAGREAWRSAAGMCWEAGVAHTVPAAEPALVRSAWERGLNAPYTSAAGRVFDAAASLLGVLDRASFEGQGGMLLEQLATGLMAGGPMLANKLAAIELPLQQDGQGLLTLDWQPLLGMLQDQSRTLAERAMQLHLALARSIVAQAERVRAQHAFEVVGLTGGVFQNKLLAELALAQLTAAGFTVQLPQRLPCNDGGIAYGQIAEVLFNNG